MNNSFGHNYTITTWGESHGKALGVVIDGCPAGLELDEEDIQVFLDRRKPGQSKYTTPRNEDDKAIILSGTMEGVTTGCPISIMVENNNLLGLVNTKGVEQVEVKYEDMTENDNGTYTVELNGEKFIIDKNGIRK